MAHSARDRERSGGMRGRGLCSNFVERRNVLQDSAKNITRALAVQECLVSGYHDHQDFRQRTVSGLSAKIELVDFAIIVRPQESSPLEDALEKECTSMPRKTINQTDASYIRNKPIAISMKVNRHAGHEDVSMVELQTWVTAHYSMLKVLLSSNNALGKVELPVLPLIQVQGHMWNLWIAEFQNSKNQIIIHRRISLGSTDTIVGIDQIIASVQRLA